jgi:hypothetical protein
MSTIQPTATKPKDPPPPPTPTAAPPKPAKKEATKIDLTAQPSTPPAVDFTGFLQSRAQPPVSEGCAKVVNSGASPAEVSGACTVREYAAMATAPTTGVVPQQTDGACVKTYEKEGAAWGEAVGEELKDLIKKAPVPIVRHRVAKAVKEATTEYGKDLSHTQGVADCKEPADAAKFAATHAPVAVATQSKAPPKPPAEPNYNFTPADPSQAMTKVK